jgi:hypothetical protein
LIRGGRHHRTRARIPKSPLDSDFAAESRTPADPHCKIEYVCGGLARCGLALQHTQRRVCATTFESIQGV